MSKPSTVSRILGFNLVALLLAAVALRLAARGSDEFCSWLGLEMAVQLLLNLLLALATNDIPRRQAHWLSLLLVLLIGFGACAGSALYW